MMLLYLCIRVLVILFIGEFWDIILERFVVVVVVVVVVVIVVVVVVVVIWCEMVPKSITTIT